mmetsp:Transcript_116944/g.342472  ORF Transcript_116944/g.342472 Transcript_116944/m.342472 type:complete len:203 (-) Transcript_116944:997-1605(-)
MPSLSFHAPSSVNTVPIVKPSLECLSSGNRKTQRLPCCSAKVACEDNSEFTNSETAVMCSEDALLASMTISIKYSEPYRNFRRRAVPRHRNLPLTWIAILVQRASASSMLCVIRIADWSEPRACKMAQRCRFPTASTAVVGSSSRIILGRPMMAIPMDSFLRMPPLYVPTALSASATEKPKQRKTASAYLSRSSSGTPLIKP